MPDDKSSPRSHEQLSEFSTLYDQIPEYSQDLLFLAAADQDRPGFLDALLGSDEELVAWMLAQDLAYSLPVERQAKVIVPTERGYAFLRFCLEQDATQQRLSQLRSAMRRRDIRVAEAKGLYEAARGQWAQRYPYRIQQWIHRRSNPVRGKTWYDFMPDSHPPKQ